MVAIKKPLRRKVAGGRLIIEAIDEGLVLRARGCRRGGSAEVGISWSKVYQHALWIRAPRKRKVRRGKI